MTRARDLADSADKDIAGTLTLDAVNASGVITGLTVEATGDTAAGDNAAMGYTAAEGLILTGQGSTSDITLKNDADAVVFSVPTGTDDILFPDNAKAIFGAGSDLQIYHDGSNSYVDDAGTGRLYLRGNDRVQIQKYTGEDMITANADGAVNLYHNNSKKFETSSTGGTISGTSGAALVIQATDANTYPGINLINDAQRYDLQIDGSSDSFRIYDNTNSTTRVVLDTSGNFLVGSTNNSPATNNVAGSSHGSLGNIQASVDGNPCLFVNRKSSDGDIISIRQDGSAVGSIGTPYNNELYITASGTNSSGILLSSSNQVRPMKNGSTSDSTQDLGASNGKWKDLYLSGGVYLGGTGAANKLDDYEEGTFTATLTSATPPSTPPTVTGLYTKIGRSVTVSMFFESVNTSGGSGSMVVTGLPFAAGSATGNRGSGAVQFYSMTFSGEYAVAEASSSQINFRGIASNAAWQDISITAGTGRYLQTTLTYTTA
jgi:hypothetical protein